MLENLLDHMATILASLLAFTVFLPLAGSVVLILRPSWDVSRSRGFALRIAFATIVLSLVLLSMFQTGLEIPQFSYEASDRLAGWPWVGQVGIRFAMGLDGLSLVLFLLTPLLVITAICSSWE